MEGLARARLGLSVGPAGAISLIHTFGDEVDGCRSRSWGGCRGSGELIEHFNFDVTESPALVSEGLVNGGAETEADIVSAVDLFIDVLVASSTAVSGPVVAIGAAGTERSQSSPTV